MSTRDEKQCSSHSTLWDRLDSPFIEAEIFTGEDEVEWTSRLTALEAEGPFQRLLEPGAQSLEPPPEFEPPEPEREPPGQAYATVPVPGVRGQAITLDRVREVASALAKSPHHREDWFDGMFSCEHWALQLAHGFIAGRVHYPKHPLTKSWPGKYRTGVLHHEAVYDIYKEEAANGISKAFPRPSGKLKLSCLATAAMGADAQNAVRPQDGYAVGYHGKALGLTDRLKFYPAGDSVGNPRELSTGWYVERGLPYDEDSYELVYATKAGKKVPVQLQSGDILDTAEGENGKRFELRHKVFVVIEGDEISLWGNVGVREPERPGKRKGVLYLIPIYRRGTATYDRRIVMGVWRFNYSLIEHAQEQETIQSIDGDAEQHERDEFAREEEVLEEMDVKQMLPGFGKLHPGL